MPKKFKKTIFKADTNQLAKSLLSSAALLIASVLVLSSRVVYVSATATIVRVSTGGVGGIQITGTPFCGGTTDVTSQFYECSQTTAIFATVLTAPDEVQTNGQNWKFAGWEGCTLNTSLASNNCSLNTTSSTTVTAQFVPDTYVLGDSTQLASTVSAANQTTGDYVPIKIGANSLPLIAYYGRSNSSQADNGQCANSNLTGECELRLIACGDSACQNGNVNRVLDTQGDVGKYASMAVSPTDRSPVISYFEDHSPKINNQYYCSAAGFADSDYCNLKVYKCATADCSSGSSTRVDTQDSVGKNTSTQVPSDGKPIISYSGHLSGTSAVGVKVVKCGNAACTANNIITVLDASSAYGDVITTSLAIGPDNLPVITYVLWNNGTAVYKLIKCTAADCSSYNSPVSYETTTSGLIAPLAEVSVGPNNTPVVGYYRYLPTWPYQAVFRVLNCTSPACNQVTTHQLDKGYLSPYPSIEINKAGLPVIADTDWDNQATAYANGNLIDLLKCSDSMCANGSLVSNNRLYSGSYSFTNMTLDAFDLPIISYWHYDKATDQKSLELIKCATTSCSASSKNLLNIEP